MRRIFTTLLLSCSFGLNAFAQNPIEDPSYLADFNYRLTDVGGKEDVDLLYSILSDDLDKNPNNVCHNRAHVWAYQMRQFKNVQSGKILIIYGNGEGSAYGATGYFWWFHIAPYVISEGKEVVMEKFLNLNAPTPMNQWIHHMTGGKDCKLLDGTETDLYEYIKDSHSIPMKVGGHPCYIRKIPMGYLAPWSVYQHDMEKKTYSNDLTTGLVKSSCMYSMAADRKTGRKRMCNEFLANPVGFEP